MTKQLKSSSEESDKTEPPGILSILVCSLFLGLIAGAGVDKSHILPVAAIAAVVLYACRNKIAAGDTPSTGMDIQISNHATDTLQMWPQSNQFAYTIAGEAYQGVIKQLLHEYTINPQGNLDSTEPSLTAHLIPENDNPYDSHSVRIDINHRTIGYLNHEEALSFHRRLAEKNLSNQITTCSAIIANTGQASNDYHIKLDIEPFN